MDPGDRGDGPARNPTLKSSQLMPTALSDIGEDVMGKDNGTRVGV